MEIDNLHVIRSGDRSVNLVYRYPDNRLYDANTFEIRRLKPDENILKVDNFIVTDVSKKLFVIFLYNADTMENIYLIIQESDQGAIGSRTPILTVLNPHSIDISIESYKLLNISFLKLPSNPQAINPSTLQDVKDIFKTPLVNKTDISLYHFGRLLNMEIPSHKSIPDEDYEYFSSIPDWKLKFLSHLNYYFLKMYKLIDMKEKRDQQNEFVPVLNPPSSFENIPQDINNLLRVPQAQERSNIFSSPIREAPIREDNIGQFGPPGTERFVASEYQSMPRQSPNTGEFGPPGTERFVASEYQSMPRQSSGMQTRVPTEVQIIDENIPEMTINQQSQQEQVPQPVFRSVRMSTNSPSRSTLPQPTTTQQEVDEHPDLVFDRSTGTYRPVVQLRSPSSLQQNNQQEMIEPLPVIPQLQQGTQLQQGQVSQLQQGTQLQQQIQSKQYYQRSPYTDRQVPNSLRFMFTDSTDPTVVGRIKSHNDRLLRRNILIPNKERESFQENEIISRHNNRVLQSNDVIQLTGFERVDQLREIDEHNQRILAGKTGYELRRALDQENPIGSEGQYLPNELSFAQAPPNANPERINSVNSHNRLVSEYNFILPYPEYVSQSVGRMTTEHNERLMNSNKMIDFTGFEPTKLVLQINEHNARVESQQSASPDRKRQLNNQLQRLDGPVYGFPEQQTEIQQQVVGQQSIPRQSFASTSSQQLGQQQLNDRQSTIPPLIQQMSTQQSSQGQFVPRQSFAPNLAQQSGVPTQQLNQGQFVPRQSFAPTSAQQSDQGQFIARQSTIPPVIQQQMSQVQPVQTTGQQVREQSRNVVSFNNPVPRKLNLLLRTDTYNRISKRLDTTSNMPANSFMFTLEGSFPDTLYVLISDYNRRKSIIGYTPTNYDTQWIKSSGGNTQQTETYITLQDIIVANNLSNLQEINPVRLALSNSKRCMVFDFDCTLTYSHFYYLLYDSDPNKYRSKFGDVLNEFGYQNMTTAQLKNIANLSLPYDNTRYQQFINIIFGGTERFTQLVFMLNMLKRLGYNLFISSHGQCDSIKEALRITGIYTLFDEINARGNGSCWKGTKDSFMDLLAHSGYRTILYADDDASSDMKFKNIMNSDPRFYNGFSYQYYGNNIGLQMEGRGLTRDMMALILNNAYELSFEM